MPKNIVFLEECIYISLYPWEYNIIYHVFFLMGVLTLLYLFLIIFLFFVDFKQTFGISWKFFDVLALFQPMVPFIKFSSKLCTIKYNHKNTKKGMNLQLFQISMAIRNYQMRFNKTSSFKVSFWIWWDSVAQKTMSNLSTHLNLLNEKIMN